jgi:tetratricopeptide (TPR) repeat protein
LRAYCHHLLGEELEAASAGRAAIECLEGILSADAIATDLTEAYLEAARLHAWLGDAERASSLARTYLGKVHDPQLRFSGLIALSEALRRQRHYQEAQAVAEEAVAAATGLAASFLALSTKAAVEVDAHELEQARETITRVSVLLPTHPYLARDLRTLTDTTWRLAETSYDLQRYKEAGEALTRILSLHAADDSDRRRALLLLGHCHLALGENAPARRCYEEVLRSPSASAEETQTARDALAKL